MKTFASAVFGSLLALGLAGTAKAVTIGGYETISDGSEKTYAEAVLVVPLAFPPDFSISGYTILGSTLTLTEMFFPPSGTLSLGPVFPSLAALHVESTVSTGYLGLFEVTGGSEAAAWGSHVIVEIPSLFDMTSGPVATVTSAAPVSMGAIPLPSSALLLLGATGALGAMVRRRARKA